MSKFSNVVLALFLISVGVGINIAIYPTVWKMCEDTEFAKDEQVTPASSSETNVVASQPASETKPSATTPVMRNGVPTNKKRWQPSEELIIIPPTSSKPTEQMNKTANNVADKVEVLRKTSEQPVPASPFEHAVQVPSNEQPESPFARVEVQIPQPEESPFQPSPHNLPLPANNSSAHPASVDIDKIVEPADAARDSRNNDVENNVTWEQPPRVPDESVAVLANNTAPSIVNAVPQPIYANQVMQPLPPVTKSSGMNGFTPRDISESLMKRTPIISAPANDRESWLGKP